MIKLTTNYICNSSTVRGSAVADGEAWHKARVNLTHLIFFSLWNRNHLKFMMYSKLSGFHLSIVIKDYNNHSSQSKGQGNPNGTMKNQRKHCTRQCHTPGNSCIQGQGGFCLVQGCKSGCWSPLGCS